MLMAWLSVKLFKGENVLHNKTVNSREGEKH